MRKRTLVELSAHDGVAAIDHHKMVSADLMNAVSRSVDSSAMTSDKAVKIIMANAKLSVQIHVEDGTREAATEAKWPHP